MSFNMNDYIDVKQRIALFYAKYPDGSLQFEFKGILAHDPDMIWGIAYAYRTPDDINPAKGHAQELAKGKTNFTRGSELQNLETSAIGRCIGMLGLGIDASLATSDEVEAAEERQRPNPVNKGPKQTRPFASDPATEAQRKLIARLAPSPAWIEGWKDEHGITGPVNKKEASALIEELNLISKPLISNDKMFERTTDGD
jgi:hypothetical protein